MKFHALTHTYATLQFENSIRVEIVSKLLGYASIGITINIYSCNEGGETEDCGYFGFG